MKQVGYYNGTIGALEEMTVPMLDRAVYFGDGCYEAAIFANDRIFGEREHFDRFYRSCSLLKIPFAMSREDLHQELLRVIRANEEEHGLLYWQASRGTWPRHHQFPPADVKPNLMAFSVPHELASMDSTYRLISMEDLRFYMCNIKTLNLLPSVLAYEECVSRGCQETVLYRSSFGKKRVTECAHSNVLILKDGILTAPPMDNLILPGITMQHLMMLAKQNGIPVRETPFTLEELMAADEIIITATGDLCNPACELDGRPVGGKDPATLKTLQDAYLSYYKRELGIQ